MLKRLLATAAAMALFVSQVEAANVPLIPAPWDPGNALGTLNTWILNSLNPNVSGAGSGAAGASMFPKNLLDNGDMWVNQRAATATCGTTTTSGMTAAANYGADRWLCDVNITTGAGQLAVTTSSPTPPNGFINQSTLVRNSGALLANQCAYQEIPTLRSTAMGGQTVDFSVYAAALAGLAADNGNQVNLYLITGTGSADGFGLRGAAGMTASVKASSFTVSTTTGLITNASTVVAGEPITMTGSPLAAGLVAGQTYYVSSALLNSGTAFAVAPTYAQAIAGTGTVIPTSGGTSDVLNLNPIFPIWTGVAVYGANNSGAGQTSARQGWGQAQSNPFTLTTSFSRISTGPISVPPGTTEAAVAICFPPAGTTSGGSTDGIAFTGAQLEVTGANVTSPSPYEFKSGQQEWTDALRFYFVLNDAANGTPIGPMGTLLTTTTCGFAYQFMEPMDTAPVFEAIGTITTTTFHIYVAADTSTLTNAGITAATLTTPTSAGFTATLTTSSTAGWACELTGQTASTAIGLAWTADF